MGIQDNQECGRTGWWVSSYQIIVTFDQFASICIILEVGSYLLTHFAGKAFRYPRVISANLGQYTLVLSNPERWTGIRVIFLDNLIQWNNTPLSHDDVKVPAARALEPSYMGDHVWTMSFKEFSN